MMLGDTRAPALCLLVSLYARSLGDADDDLGRRLSSHAALAALDIGLASAPPDGGGEVIVDRAAHETFLATELAPFDGSAAQAAFFALALAAVRVGVLDEPEPPSIESITEVGARLRRR
jgi:hypothetical protein